MATVTKNDKSSITISNSKIVSGFIKGIVIYVLHYLSHLSPRNKKLWLYSSLKGEFVDNAKYLFLYANEHCKNVRHVWITDSDDVINYLRSRGFEAYHKQSRKSIKLALRAKAFIYSAYSVDVANPAYSGGAFLFNLWHGIPLKKIEYDINKGPLRYLYNPSGWREHLIRFVASPPITKRHHAVLATSNEVKKSFRHTFKVKEKNILVAQYPRLLPFFVDSITVEKHIEKIEPGETLFMLNTMKQFKQVWVYMPTWRDTNPLFIAEALPDLELLNRVCCKNRILFLIKTHINTVFESDMSNYSNIQLLNRNVDIYPLLPFTHALITDYSSIFFDYSLLNKRIIFYAYDVNEYLDGSRDFYYDYNEIIAGREVAYTFEEFLQLIGNGNNISRQNNYEKLVNHSSDFNAPIEFIKSAINFKG